MNRWKLAEETEETYKIDVLCFIKDVQDVDLESSVDLLERDYSDTPLNPYTLCKLLENLGYKETDRQDNGWELDFWITMEHSEYPTIQVKGSGMTFELLLSEVE